MAGLRDRIGDALGDDEIDPGRWGDRIEDLLYEGETVEDAVDVDDGRVVVTSHRVLTFTPDLEGANFDQAERPNVVGVRRGAKADTATFVRGVKWTLLGAIGVVAGVLVDLDGIIGDVDLQSSATEQVGFGGTLGFVRQILDLIRQGDELLQVVGALAMLFGVLVLGVYVWNRDTTVELEVAGDGDDLHVPRPDDETVIDRIEAAVSPDRSPQSAGSEPVDRDDDPLAEP